MKLEKLRYLIYGDFVLIQTKTGRIAVVDQNHKIIQEIPFPDHVENWRLDSLHDYIKDKLAEADTAK